MLRRTVVNKPPAQQPAAGATPPIDNSISPHNTTVPSTTTSTDPTTNQPPTPATTTTTTTTTPASKNTNFASGARMGLGGSTMRYGKGTNPKGYFSARVETKTAFTVFDQYGRAQACPQCCTSRITQPGIKLKYATCCGRVLCIPCRDSMCKPSLPCDTPNCIGMLDLSTWSDSPVDEYRYKLECQKRKEMGRLGALEPGDFEQGDQHTFDDYAEALQALLYDYTYGNIPLVADLGIARSAMERKYTVQIQRHEQVVQNKLAQAQWEQNQQDDLEWANSLQLNPAEQRRTAAQDPPHLEQLYREYQYYHNFAARLELELYTQETWEKEFLAENRAERFKNFQHIPPVPPIESIPVPGVDLNGSDTAMKDGDDTTTNNPTNPPPQLTKAQLATRQTAFDRLRIRLKAERIQRDREEYWDIRTDQADAGGFVDLSLVPITEQYNRAIAELHYENDYDTM